MANKKVTHKTARKKKATRKIDSNIDLILEGAVFIAEYDSQGKMISKVELDGEAVLKALVYVLNKATKKKKKP